MTGLTVWLAVAGGGALGALARHGVGRLTLHWFGPGFPWGTFFVNIVGSFLMGALIVWLSFRDPVSPAVRAFLSVGLLGAFTTFSTFSLDVVVLIREKAVMEAGFYVAGSLVLAVAGLLAGMALARSVL